MMSWYKQKHILLIVIFLVLGQQNSLLARKDSSTNLVLASKTRESSQLKAQTLLARKAVVCQDVNSAYQEVYSFATEDYHISICKFRTNFYYHRQSKTDVNEKLWIPAKLVFGGDVFQATHGKTIYFIGQDGDRYYSSVMKNNSEIVFEPEIKPVALSSSTARNFTSDANSSRNSETEDLNRSRRSTTISERRGMDSKSQAEAISRANFESQESIELELDSPEKNVSSQSMVCANHSSILHPHLNGWQQLIGKSTDIANQYAVNNGHNFIYDGSEPEAALIETKKGELVNLEIATASDTVDSVCVRPITE